MCGGGQAADWPLPAAELQEKALPSIRFSDSLTHVLAELRDTLIVEHERATAHQEQVLRQEVHALRHEMQLNQGPSQHKDADLSGGSVVVPTVLSTADRKVTSGTEASDAVLAALNPKFGFTGSPAAKQDLRAAPQGAVSTPKRQTAKGRLNRNLDLFRINPLMRKVSFSEELVGATDLSLRSSSKATPPEEGEKAVDDMEQEAPKRHWLPARLRSDKKLQAFLVDSTISFAIVLNVLVLGMSVDVSPDWSGWLALDASFASFFLVESLLRLRVLGCGHFFHGNEWKWNVTEAALVAFAWLELALNAGGVMDSSDNAFVRTIRLLRIARLLRVCRLRVFRGVALFKTAIGSVQLLIWALALVAVPLYAMALVFRETLGAPPVTEDSGEMFSSVGLSLFTLFRCVLGSDCSEAGGKPIFYPLLRSQGWLFALLYVTAVVVVTFGLCNVIVAYFVENVVSSAKTNEYLVKKRRACDEAFFIEKIVELLEVVWDHSSKASQTGSSSGGVRRMSTGCWSRKASDAGQGLAELRVTPEFLQELRQSEQFASALRDLDIADEDQYSLFETLDTNRNGVIDLEEFVSGLSRLRGAARRFDVVQVDLTVRTQHQEILRLFEGTFHLLRSQESVLRSVLECVGRRREEASFALGFKHDLY